MALNTEQEDALNKILQGDNVFLTGPGGTGKSYLIQRIVETFNAKNHKVAVTALTGCAALLLGHQAKTIYSWAGIGLGREAAAKIAADIRKLPYKNKVLRRWLLTRTLIIDEVSMMTPAILELLDDVGQLVRRDSKPFGGIQVVLVGDFFQLPPVMKQEGDEKVETQFAFESERWKTLNLKNIVLKQMMRQDDTGFQEILNQARWGRLTKESFMTLEARQGQRWQELKIKPTLLFSRRAEVEMINERNLAALQGPTQTFHAKTVFDTTCQKDYNEKSPEVIRATTKLDRDAPYKATLELKVGTQVMLVYNLDQEHGLVNGSRGVVEGFKEGLPLVLFKGHSAPIPISRQTWESEDLEGVKRSQIPLILAYAVTIHKCQGATLDSALIDIGPSTFEVGQAYVALSRVKSLDALYIYDVDPLAFKAHPKVCRFYESL